jgi:hypothetical protein
MELSKFMKIEYHLFNSVAHFDKGYNMSLNIEDFIAYVTKLIS